MRGRDAYASELRTIFESQHIEALNDIQEVTVSATSLIVGTISG